MEDIKLERIASEILKEKTTLLGKTKINEQDLLKLAEYLKQLPQFEVRNLFDIIIHNEL